MNIVILGGGGIGFQLAKRLSLEKHNIILIELDKKRANYAKEQLDVLVIEGSGSSPELLKKADIDQTDVIAALTNSDEVNIFSCQLAKKAGSPITIARVRNPEFTENSELFSKKEFGVDYVLQPELLTANSIVRLVKQSSATDLIDFEKGKIQFLGLRLDSNSKVLHTPLKDLGKKYGNPPLTVVAIKRKQYTIIPRGEDMLIENDQIFIICEPDYFTEALKFFGKDQKKVENVMITGGGLLGQFIAEKLENDYNVKIFETDEAKSNELAGKLNNALVIHGDGTDIDLLTFEGLSDMDEFIAVTGDDESNIITSLVARHLRVPRTITLVTKLEYQALAPSIGMDSVISKQLITVNAIRKFIRRHQVAFFAELPGVDAEIIEYFADDKSKIIKKPLKNINFPRDAVAGAVIKKDGAVEVPKGETHIRPGDKVIVFTLPKAMKDVDKLFE